jgi:hypothetical protein
MTFTQPFGTRLTDKGAIVACTAISVPQSVYPLAQATTVSTHPNVKAYAWTPPSRNSIVNVCR